MVGITLTLEGSVKHLEVSFYYVRKGWFPRFQQDKKNFMVWGFATVLWMDDWLMILYVFIIVFKK